MNNRVWRWMVACALKVCFLLRLQERLPGASAHSCCIFYIRGSKESHLVTEMSVGMESCNPPMHVQRAERKKYLLSSFG